MDIAEVAKRSGVRASTLRYYEEKGLIASVGRDGLRRRFAPGVLDQLALIALGQAAGFSLDEIRRMFSPEGTPAIDRRMLAAKADEVDRTIVRLRAMSRGLRHAAECPGATTRTARRSSGCSGPRRPARWSDAARRAPPGAPSAEGTSSAAQRFNENARARRAFRRCGAACRWCPGRDSNPHGVTR